MKIQYLKKTVGLFGLLAVFATALVLTGCGGGGSGGNNSGANTNTNQTSDLAPDSIGGKTFNGHIGGTSTTWRIVFIGAGNSGTYTYAENGRQLDSGAFTYTKTGSDTGVVTLADGTALQLTYTSPNSGSYLIPKSGETGAFTSN